MTVLPQREIRPERSLPDSPSLQEAFYCFQDQVVVVQVAAEHGAVNLIDDERTPVKV